MINLDYCLNLLSKQPQVDAVSKCSPVATKNKEVDYAIS